MSFAEEIVSRIDALAQISETPGELTRVFLSAEHRRAADLIAGWMREAGMEARMDAIGNIVGRYEGETAGAPCLLIGSHYDTVRNAGKWDGPLGVLTPISCIAELKRRGKRFPFAIEVVAFADEEGARFSSTLLGSRALAGTFDTSVLAARDADGMTMSEALTAFDLDPGRISEAARPPHAIHCYLELHIEQGPVLEVEDLPVGVVSAISGATRLLVTMKGTAGHAGTVPMALRRDALAGAAECIVAIETECAAAKGVVGTVGHIAARPGSTNVIPGEASFTVDIRAADDNIRNQAVTAVTRHIIEIAERRGLKHDIVQTHANSTTHCALRLRKQIAEAIRAQGWRPLELVSGAGHDAMAVARIADIGMLFIRCRGGVSHHPDEHVEPADVETAAQVLLRFIEGFRP